MTPIQDQPAQKQDHSNEQRPECPADQELHISAVLDALSASEKAALQRRATDTASSSAEDGWVHTFHELAPDVFHLPS